MMPIQSIFESPLLEREALVRFLNVEEMFNQNVALPIAEIARRVCRDAPPPHKTDFEGACRWRLISAVRQCASFLVHHLTCPIWAGDRSPLAQRLVLASGAIAFEKPTILEVREP